MKIYHRFTGRLIFEGADLTNADLMGADLANANLAYADLTNADLTNADLMGADLTNANLMGADLANANLTNANLTNADLTNADLMGANLDFSCLPLWCGSLKMKLDKNQLAQIAYHLHSLIQFNEGEHKSTLNIANSWDGIKKHDLKIL